MNRRMDEIVKGYPELVQKRDCLAYQLAHFRGFTADEIIESMYTPRQDGERVQTSNLSDKTAQIALDYQERRERINREWYEQKAIYSEETGQNLTEMNEKWDHWGWSKYVKH